MTQENKELLLKDLSARLPHKVVINAIGPNFNINSILTDIHYGLDSYVAISNGMQYHIESIKPYLYPLSSMTEEQKIEYDYLHSIIFSCYEDGLSEAIAKLQDFYKKNHLDDRGLIPKGLAKDATGLNIY